MGNFHIIVRRDRSLEYDAASLIRELRTPYMYHSFNKTKQSLYNFAVPRIKMMTVESNDVGMLQSNTAAGPSAISFASKVSESSSSSDLNCDPIIKEPKRLSPWLHSFLSTVNDAHLSFRVYYHASVGLPLFPQEEEADSDDEIDASIQAVAENMLLEEYADMSFEEKVRKHRR